MVAIGKRMNNLKSLLQLRNGPGAAILPPEVSRIHLNFALRWNDGHFGPRKFWRNALPRLKYHNPAIPMLVNRSNDNAGPATLTIYFQNNPPSSTSSSTTTSSPHPQPQSSTTNTCPAPAPVEGERTETIDMKHAHEDDILAQLMQKTGAVQVIPDAAEAQEIAEMEDLKMRAESDRQAVKRYVEGQRKEQAMLAQARSEADAIRASN